MRIGIDIRFYDDGTSFGRYNKELVTNLIKIDKKNEYVLFTRHQNRLKLHQLLKKYRDRKLELHYFDAEYFSWQEQLKFPGVIKKANLDLMHFTNFNVPIRYSGKFVVSFHDLILLFWPGRKKRKKIYRAIAKFVMKKACQNSEKIFSLSEYTRKDIIKIFKVTPSKIVVAYPGASPNLKKVQSTNRIAKILTKYKIKQPYFLYLGQWRIHKNIPGLICAFKKVLQKLPRYYLVLAGKEDPAFPEVKKTIEKLGLQEKVFITGFIEEKDLAAIYSGARVFVFPSFYEGFGLPALESMGCGVPVAASNKSCLPEVLGPASVYFNPKNISQMAQKMIALATKTSLRKSKIQKGFAQVKKFSWQKMAEEILKVYNSIK